MTLSSTSEKRLKWMRIADIPVISWWRCVVLTHHAPTGWGQVRSSTWLTRSWQIWQEKSATQLKLCCYKTAITKSTGLRDNSCIHIWIFISNGWHWNRWARMGERTTHPSHSLPFSVLHSLLSYISFSCNHHFNASFPFCIFHPLLPSRLPLFFLISPDLLLFPLNAIPLSIPSAALMYGKRWSGKKRKSVWLMSLRKR